MPSQRFDISILLNVLSQGDEKIDELAKSFKRLSKAGEIAGKSLEKDFFGADVTNKVIDRIEKIVRSIRKLDKVDIGGTKSFDELRAKIFQLQTQADKGIFLNVNTDLKELNIYLKRLEDIKFAAEKLDDKKLFTEISSVIDGAKLLKANFEQISKVSLDKNIASFKVLLDETNARIKQTVKEAKSLASTGSTPADLNPYITQLKEARDNLKFLSKEAQNLGLSTKTIDASIEKLNTQIKDLKTGKPAQIGTVQGLDELIQQFNKFEAKAKAGIPIDFLVDKAELDQLQKKLVAIRNEAAKNQDIQIFRDSTTLLGQLEAARQELKRIEQIQLDKSITPYKFELKQASTQLKDLTKQGQNLIDTGADVATLKILQNKILDTRTELIRLRDEAERLGKSTVDINIKIAESEKILNVLSGINSQQVQIKRNEIDLKVKNKLELDDAISKLKDLNKQLNDAVDKRDFKAINDIKRKADEIKSLQTQLGPRIRNSGNVQAINVFSGFTQGLNQAEERIKGFEKEAGSGLTLLFNRLGANFRNAFRNAGGTNAATKAVAGSFRLLGTSAFVVGGELRTLGFAFSALGTIVQNFFPLLATLVTSLGAVSIPLIAIAGYFFSLSVQGLAFAGVLGAIASEGLKFNDAFARTRNNIAGIVGLFFDVKENGQDVGKGLEPTEAALARLAGTSKVVSKELRELTFEALTTEFTTEELFPAFNAVATSASKLAPNLEQLRELTGGLARVSSVAGVSATNLGSAITQLISGTGRVTNPLQRFFNQIKDSEGISLTAKRIRELRDAGGTKLINELLAVTEKFSVLGEEQAKTLSGSFSNIVDAFELFSGKATEKAYDTLRFGFIRIKDLVTEQVQKTRIDAEGVLQAVTIGPKGKEKPLVISQFTKPVLELQNTLNNLFNKISNDFLGFFNKVVAYVLSIGKALTDNYGTILSIYETLKFIGKSTFQILKDFLSILGISNNTTSSLRDIFTILKSVAVVTYGIRLAFIGLETIISSLILTFSALFRLVLKFQQATAIFPNERDAATAALKELDEFNTRLANGVLTSGQRAREARAEFEEYKSTLADLSKPKYQKYKEIVDTPEAPTPLTTLGRSQDTSRGSQLTPERKVERLLEEGATVNEIASLGFDGKFINKVIKNRDDRFTLQKNPFNGSVDDETNKKIKQAKDRNVALDDEQKRFIEAQVSYAKAGEQAQYNLVRDRLNRQQSLLQAQLNANIIAQETATAKTLEIKQREVEAEKFVKFNEISRIKEKQADLDAAFEQEKARIIKEVKTRNQLQGRLEQLELKRNTEKLKNKEEILKIEGEIALIQERQLDLQLDTLNAQLSSRVELLKTNQELKRGLLELSDNTSASTLAANQRNIVADQAEQLRKLQTAADNLKPSDFANLGVFGGAGAFLQAKQLLTENLDLLKKQLDLRIELARFDFTQNVFQSRQNELRLDEENIQQDLAVGAISEYEAAVRTRALRLQVVEALKLANDELDKLNNKTSAQEQLIKENKLTIRKLSEELPDSGILDVTKGIGDSFTTLFEKIQEDVGNTKNAFSDLANSILGSFRKLIAQRLSEALFEKLLTPKGKVGGFLESLGLSRTAKINEEAVARTANQANEALQKTEASLGQPQKTAQSILDDLNNEFKSKTGIFTDALSILANKINNVSLAIPVFNATSAKAVANEALTTNILTQISSVGVENLVVNNLMLTELRNISSLLATTGSTSGSYNFGSLIPEEKNGGLIGKLKYFAKGGAAKGADVIPAYLSNGEFIVSPEMVNKIGLPILNYLNKFGKIPKFASGGLFENFGIGRSGPTSFGGLSSFANGAASLLKKPEAIVEKILAPTKKKGGLKSIFGNILSFAAPFLRFIPAIGPFLSLGAGALGGALTGSNKGALGGVLGGIFGGLSNLGGFTGKGGFLGNLAGKVGSPTGQAGLSLFSGLLGNGGNALGQATAGAFSSGKFSNIFSSLKGIGGSAFLKKILGFFDIFKFGKSFDLTSILGKKSGGLIPKLASGGQPDIGKLLGLFGAITSISRLFGKGNEQAYSEEIIDDPDAARKNLFGSAYSGLIGAGFIPDFKYSAETLKKLQNQFAGIKNLVKNPSQSFFSKLFEILPSLAGLFNLGKSSGSVKSSGTEDLGAISGFASGGKVVGKGTGTSDSIFSMLRPESFIIKARSVKALEESLLSSIDSQIFRFADGGSVNSELLKALPDLAPNISTGNQSVSIHNYADFDSAFAGYLSSPQGQKKILNTINRNKNGVNGMLRGRR